MDASCFCVPMGCEHTSYVSLHISLWEYVLKLKNINLKKSKVWTHLILFLLLIYFVLRVNLLKVLSNKYNYFVYNNNTFIHSFITFTYSLICLFICFFI